VPSDVNTVNAVRTTGLAIRPPAGMPEKGARFSRYPARRIARELVKLYDLDKERDRAERTIDVTIW